MKTKIISIHFIVIMIMALMSSCQKETLKEAESVEVGPVDQQDISHEKPIIVSVDKDIDWIALIMDIILSLAEGQYTRLTHPDGLVEERCRGIGKCAINGVVQIGGNSESLSSEEFNLFDVSANGGFIGVTQEGEVILGIDRKKCSQSSFDAFFGRQHFELSKEFVIDNPEVLSAIGLVSPIVFPSKSYKVFHQRDLSYIKVSS